MLTVKKIKDILIHDKVYYNSQLKPEKFRYESDLYLSEAQNGRLQLYPKKISDNELIEKFKKECIEASKYYSRSNKSQKLELKIDCKSLKEAKEDLRSSDLTFEKLVEFDNRKFAFAAPEYVGVICEDTNGWMDLKIVNPNGVVEIKEK